MKPIEKKEAISEVDNFAEECKKSINESNSGLSKWFELNKEIFKFMYDKLTDEKDRLHIDKLTQKQQNTLN